MAIIGINKNNICIFQIINTLLIILMYLYTHEISYRI